MPRLAKYIFSSFLILLFQILPATGAHACALHSGFGETNINAPEGAMWVDIQTQMAMQAGEFSPTKLIEGNSGYMQTTFWLHALTMSLSEEEFEDTHIFVSDIGLWARYNAGSQSALSLEIAPAAATDKVLILSRQGLHALASGHLTLQRGIELGVIKFG